MLVPRQLITYCCQQATHRHGKSKTVDAKQIPSQKQRQDIRVTLSIPILNGSKAGPDLIRLEEIRQLLGTDYSVLSEPACPLASFLPH
jgi:hypothetical protein